MLERISGPSCPQCGYEGSDLVATTERKKWAGGACISAETVEQRQCQHCGRRYSHLPDQPGAAVWQPLHCPACDSSRTYVRSTRTPLRYHVCADCGHSFKSYQR